MTSAKDKNKISPSADNKNVFIYEGQFTQLKAIGRGGFGIVYSAVWNYEFKKQNKVAIKVFNDVIDDEKALRDYREEVYKMSLLIHKNVIAFFGETQINEKNAIVMELALQSLDKVIHDKQQSYLTIEALRWLIDVAEGVIYMHENKFIHRDLKPANILLFQERDGSIIAKISDFGISREKQTTNSTMTAEIGTAAYTAPEVSQGLKYDRRCDVYSFGIVMWEVFSRQKPFAGMANVPIILAVFRDQRPDSKVINCDEDLRMLMENCWNGDYKKRLEMNEVKKKLNLKVEARKIKINEGMKKELRTSSIEKWDLLSRLPTNLKSRVRLAAVLSNSKLSSFVFVTENDEVYWKKKNEKHLEKLNYSQLIIKSISELKIKSLEICGVYRSLTCIFALTENGKVLAFSENENQLVKGMTGSVDSRTWTLVFSLTDKIIVELSCGDRHAIALTLYSEVFSWGDNSLGQLGTGTTDDQTQPVTDDNFQPVQMAPDIGSRRTIAVACGMDLSLAITDNGEVYSWGSNFCGQLGIGSEIQFISTPTQIKALLKIYVKRLVCGYGHVLGVADDGSMFAWGLNNNGQLGTGDRENRNQPVKVGPSDIKFIEVAASISDNQLSVALSEDGRCWVWGLIKKKNVTECMLLPIPVESVWIHDAIADNAVYQSTWKTMVIRQQIKLKEFSTIFKDFKIDPTLEKKLTTSSIEKWHILEFLPFNLKSQILLTSRLVSKDGFYKAICITKNDQAFLVKSRNRNDLENFIFTRFDELSNLKINSLFSFGFNSLSVLALTYNGHLLAWSDEALPLGKMIKEKLIDLTMPGKKLIQVACSFQHALALTSDGEVFAWGDNRCGQLGTGSTVNQTQPIKLNVKIGSQKIVAVACTYDSSFAITNNGEVWSWGSNLHGELGIDSEINCLTPTRIDSLANVKVRRLTCGWSHVLALADDGSLFAWGYNLFGQLRTGDKKNKKQPVNVGPSYVKFINLAISDHYYTDLSVALSEDGRCWFWGISEHLKSKFSFDDGHSTNDICQK